jgi:hypothetical protein
MRRKIRALARQRIAKGKRQPPENDAEKIDIPKYIVAS